MRVELDDGLVRHPWRGGMCERTDDHQLQECGIFKDSFGGRLACLHDALEDLKAALLVSLRATFRL